MDIRRGWGVRKVYMSESVGPNSGGRLLGRWRDRVKEYMCERGATRGGGLDQARRECLNRERWRTWEKVLEGVRHHKYR